jgi:hypothetical protein
MEVRLTAKEYAARKGISDRAVRMRLQKGTLPGYKAFDPEVGAEVWWVELPDYPESDPGSFPEDERPFQEDPGTGPEGVGRVVVALQAVIEKLYRDNLELGGRLGFYQARMQELEAANTQLLGRIALLEAPKEPPVETSNHPPPSQNGQDSSSQQDHLQTKRPWWAFWRAF